jgi:mono/diheme cytochrome c family protein
VHLPIGFLLLACLFLWQNRKDRFQNLQLPINISLGLGMASAIVSCITGYILSRVGDYEEGMIQWHQWMGISVAVVATLAFFFRRKPYLQRWQWLLATLLLGLIFVTGHLGGSLTHGSDYLTAPLQNLSSGQAGEVAVYSKPIADVQQAQVYGDIIEPLLQARCYHCHGPNRQKGKLRLDSPAWIKKGGKDGAVLVPGKADSSELVKRLFLPLEDEHHMAPKDRQQLTKEQRTLLRWWVVNGADFNKKVKDLPQTPDLATILVSLENPSPDQATGMSTIPSTAVDRAEEKDMDRLQAVGVVILPVAQNSNYLQVNFITAENARDTTLNLLLPLKRQLVWLKLGRTPISDQALRVVGQLGQLTRLALDHTNITDSGLHYLAGLGELQSLNLVGDSITASGLRQLQGLKKLKSLYLFATQVDKKSWDTLVKEFPQTMLDSGGYSLAFIPSDTVIVRAPKTP